MFIILGDCQTVLAKRFYYFTFSQECRSLSSSASLPRLGMINLFNYRNFSESVVEPHYVFMNIFFCVYLTVYIHEVSVHIFCPVLFVLLGFF